MLGALVTEAKVIVDKIRLQIQILSLNVTNIKEQTKKQMVTKIRMSFQRLFLWEKDRLLILCCFSTLSFFCPSSFLKSGRRMKD